MNSTNQRTAIDLFEERLLKEAYGLTHSLHMDLSPAIVSSTVRQMIWCCNKLILIDSNAVKSLIIRYRVALIYVYKAIAHFTAKQKVKKKTMACKYLEIDTRQRR